MAGGLVCTVKCAGACFVACAADTVSPIADILGAATGEATFWSQTN